MNQGIRHSPLFFDDQDRHRFLADLRYAADRVGTAISCFCLMGTHYHLVLSCPDGGLSSTMQVLAGRYARWFNRRHHLNGSLFRGRFVSIEITDDAQNLVTNRYVHRNPLELGIDPETYPWSSCQDYLAPRPRNWIDTSPILEQVGGRKEYRRFLREPFPADRFSIHNGRRKVALTDGGANRDLASIAEALDILGASTWPASERRHATVLLVADLDGADSASIAEALGLGNPAAARALHHRARSRERCDSEFAAAVAAARVVLTTREAA